MLTIYIPTHNYARYLDAAIQSVLTQTFRNFELIIINDGSTDHTEEILAQYENTEGITIVRQQNKGLIPSCNVALQMAKGEFFMRLDADDQLVPRALERLMQGFEDSPEVALVFPDYFITDEAGQVIREYRRPRDETEEFRPDQPAHGACTMLRTRVLHEIGGYDESFRRQDGLDIWLHVIKKYKVRHIPEPLFFYRQHAASLSRDVGLMEEEKRRILLKHGGLRGITA